MRLSTIIIVLFMAVGLAVLCSLGWWQVQRLHWKEDLIARVDGRLSADPVSLNSVAQTGFVKEKHEYLPVTISGTYDHSAEVYFFGANKQGNAGWNVHTPLKTGNGDILIVNRGFVPFDMKVPAKRMDGQVSGLQQVTGLLRFPLSEKPSSSYANAIEKREFYWRNVPEMSQAMGFENAEKILPVILDADETANPGGWPKGGTTIIKFTNSHLQYAGTWFGLALTLLIVGSYFLYTRRQKVGNREN